VHYQVLPPSPPSPPLPHPHPPSLLIPVFFWQFEHEYCALPCPHWHVVRVVFNPRRRYHSRTDAFKQLSVVSVSPETCPPSNTGVASCIRSAIQQQYDPSSGKVPVFHITTDPAVPNFKLESSAGDAAFGIKLRNTLHLRRNTEYCQWQEHYTQTCARCSDGSDSQGRTKYKDCNCVRTYHYVKGWHSHRTNSLLFNQPAAHHNPQRDPYPSADFFAQDAKVGSTAIDPALVNNEHSSVRGAAHYIDWNPTASHQKGSFDWLMFFKDRTKDTHYYHTSDLRGYHESPATLGSKAPARLRLRPARTSRAVCR
jgi:hypothetical protein